MTRYAQQSDLARKRGMMDGRELAEQRFDVRMSEALLRTQTSAAG